VVFDPGAVVDRKTQPKIVDSMCTVMLIASSGFSGSQEDELVGLGREIY
jgi:hypothetical protein